MQKIAGTHLIIDGYVRNASVLAKDNMLQLFDKLVEALGMQYLTPTVAKEVPTDLSKLTTEDDDGGWSYYCMITTSHIAAHTWELRRAIMMDVFSCKPFDSDKAMAILHEMLDFEAVVRQNVSRLDPNEEPERLGEIELERLVQMCP